MNRQRESPRGTYLIPLIVVVAILTLPYVPLVLALAEDAVFNSNHIVRICRDFGIHDELSWLYDLTGLD